MGLRSVVINSREKRMVISLISRFFKVMSKNNPFYLIIQILFTRHISGQLCTSFSFKSVLLKITVPTSLPFHNWKESSIAALMPMSIRVRTIFHAVPIIKLNLFWRIVYKLNRIFRQPHRSSTFFILHTSVSILAYR